MQMGITLVICTILLGEADYSCIGRFALLSLYVACQKWQWYIRISQN